MLANATHRVASFVREFFGDDDGDSDGDRASRLRQLDDDDVIISCTTTATATTEASTLPKNPPAENRRGNGYESGCTSSGGSLAKPQRHQTVGLEFVEESDDDDDSDIASESELSLAELIRRLRHYGNLLAKDEVISRFLSEDTCLRLADKTLLAIAFVYFVRSRLRLSEYTRSNFFACLWLAHETEEEYDNLRLSLLPAWLGTRWKRLLKHAGKARTALWRRMNYRTVVTDTQLAPIVSRLNRHLPHLACRERPSAGPHPTALRHSLQPAFSPGAESGPACVWCRSANSRRDQKNPDAFDRQQQLQSNIRLRPLRYRSIIDLSPEQGSGQKCTHEPGHMDTHKRTHEPTHEPGHTDDHKRTREPGPPPAKRPRQKLIKDSQL